MKEGFTGISFPFRVGNRGVVMTSTTIQDVSHIKESISQILLTGLGERVHQPEFGSDLASYVFFPVDEGMYGLIDYEIRRALEKWEPRIIINNIDFEPLEETLNITLDFTVTKYEGSIFSTKIEI